MIDIEKTFAKYRTWFWLEITNAFRSRNFIVAPDTVGRGIEEGYP